VSVSSSARHEDESAWVLAYLLLSCRRQVGYRVAVYEGLNSQHSAKAQLLLGVPSEREEWLSYSCDLLELASAG